MIVRVEYDCSNRECIQTGPSPSHAVAQGGGNFSIRGGGSPPLLSPALSSGTLIATYWTRAGICFVRVFLHRC